MIFNQKYKINIEDIDSNNEATNRAILEKFEDIACLHAAYVDQGPLSVQKNGFVWVLLNWEIKVIKRPKYADEVIVNTWSRKVDRMVAYRDFEMKNEDGITLAIATSKWCLIDINTRRPIKIDEHIDVYESEFRDSILGVEIPKLSEPTEYIFEKEYKIRRSDIDMNDHMHNLNYLDLAYEVLPEDVYKNFKFSNITIEYKKELKYGESVKCCYTQNENEHIVVIKNEKKVNAIVVLS